MMMKINLSVPSGEHVATVEMLCLQPLPPIVCWGSRFFEFKPGDDATLRPEYSEIFCYFIPPVPVHVYARPECVFAYCPNQHPDHENPCKESGTCQQPAQVSAGGSDNVDKQ